MPRKALLDAVVNGFAAVPGRKGWYTVRPSQVTDLSPLRRMRREAEAISGMADEEHFNRANMLYGGIEDLIGARQRAVSLGLRDAEPTRGLLHLTPSGRPDVTAAIDLEYGKNMLRGHARMGHDDPWVREFKPNYLNHVAVDNPDISGRSALRMLQQMYGEPMLFQVADPTNNVKIYEAMGAKRAPRAMGGSDLLGDAEMPAYYFDRLIEPKKYFPGVSLDLPLE